MAGPIKISFLADVGRAQKDIKAVADTTQDVGQAVEKSGGGMSKGLDAIGQSAVGMNAAVDAATSGLQAIDAIQNGARNEANRLARAQQDVKQSMLDGEQAAVDLRQATEDLKQAQIDGKQAAIDATQAHIDKKQADLDVTMALRDYSTAVKEHGKNSDEARQAEIDLAQANADSKQATLDLTQAQADERQAQIDATQAKTDGRQASIDAKDATLNLAEAQNAVNPTAVQQAMHAVEMYAPVLAMATIAAQGLASATGIASAATGVWTGIQAAFNFVMAMNPIVLVILAITALIAVIVLAYQHSETFRKIADGAFRWVLNTIQSVWNWVRGNWPLLLAILTGPIGLAVRWIVQHWDQIVAATKALPGKIGQVFSGIGNLLRNAGQRLISGFIDGVRDMYGSVQNTLGDLTNRLTSWKGPASRDSKLLRNNGRLVIGGFLDGLESQYGAVQSSLGGFTDSLASSASVGGTVTVSSSAPAWAQRLEALLDGGLTITLDSDGAGTSDALLEFIRERVSVKGGRASVLGVTS